MKKILIISLIAVFSVANIAFAENHTPTIVRADVNGSGEVNIADAQCMNLAVAHGMLGYDKPACATVATNENWLDVLNLNCTGEVDVTDLLITIRLSLGGGLSKMIDYDQNGVIDMCEK